MRGPEDEERGISTPESPGRSPPPHLFPERGAGKRLSFSQGAPASAPPFERSTAQGCVPGSLAPSEGLSRGHGEPPGA